MKLPNNIYVVSSVQASRESYQYALEQEMLIGSDVSLDDISENRINRQPILDYKARILGGKSHSKHYADWLDSFIEEFGPREKCLSVGSGLGRVEKYLVDKGFTKTIEAVELCADVNEKNRIGEVGVNVVAGDFNFMELPSDSYDFILCHGVLHHLINLESVLFQLNQALKVNGIIMIYEYIGETRWQFSEERMGVLKREFPDIDFRIPKRWEVPGFESVRSADLLALVRTYFSSNCVREVLYGGIYFPFVTSTNDMYDQILPKVLGLDESLGKLGEVKPCYLMGIYGKNPSVFAAVVPWSDQQLDKELIPPAPIKVAIKRRLRNTMFWPVLTKLKRLVR